MVKRALVLLALCLVAVAAAAAPRVGSNTPQQARTWAYCDSTVHFRGVQSTLPPRSVYLIEGVTVQGEADSVVKAWQAGGATPKFRRIQGMIIYSEGLSAQYITLDFFHPDGTSANNKCVFKSEMVFTFPVEADSIHLAATTANNSDLNICLW